VNDGSTVDRYFRTLPDGTQAWTAEVRNGAENQWRTQCHSPMSEVLRLVTHS
jgi:hypothetical protein